MQDNEKGFDEAASRFNAAVRTVMGTTEGRAVLAWVLECSGLWASSFDADPIRMAALCGQRHVGLRVSKTIEGLAPDDYEKLLREVRERELGE